MEQLTVKEALAQGYTSYLYHEDGYQSLKDISDVESIEFNRKPCLVEKEPYHPSGMSAQDIAELIAEHIECNHESETGDDTLQVFEALKDLDYSEIAAKIDEALSKLDYYHGTDIRLIP